MNRRQFFGTALAFPLTGSTLPAGNVGDVGLTLDGFEKVPRDIYGVRLKDGAADCVLFHSCRLVGLTRKSLGEAVAREGRSLKAVCRESLDVYRFFFNVFQEPQREPDGTWSAIVAAMAVPADNFDGFQKPEPLLR